jgi:hypothetical protein
MSTKTSNVNVIYSRKFRLQIRETTINLHRPTSEELPTLLLILPFNVKYYLFLYVQ